MKPRICVNCGATLYSNKCEYCDTEYEQDKNEQEILELQRKITADKLKMLNNIQPRPLSVADLPRLSVPLQMSRYEDYKNKLTECCCDNKVEYPPSKTTIERIEEWRKEMRKKWRLE